MIPDEAVEAIARGVWIPQELDDEWADEPHDYKEHLRTNARAALEAAAPHMTKAAQAEAWDECADRYVEQLVNVTLDWEELPNPYKKDEAPK